MFKKMATVSLFTMLVLGTGLLSMYFVTLSGAKNRKTLTKPVVSVPTTRLNLQNQNLAESTFQLPNLRPQPRYMKSIHLDDDNSVYVFGEIDENSVAQAIGKIDSLNDDGVGPIYMVIDSPGGSVLAGMKLISTMKYSQRPIYTVCVELCASMAAYTHQYGRVRYIADNSILMFHDAFGASQGNIRQQLSMLQLISSMLDQMDEHVALKSHQNLQSFQYIVQSHNLWLTSFQAVEEGFADGMANVVLPSDVSASLTNGAKVNPNKLPGNNSNESIVKWLRNIRM